MCKKEESLLLGGHPDAIQAASEGIRNAIEENNNAAQKFSLRQFRFLHMGSVLYVSWHELEMYLRVS